MQKNNDDADPTGPYHFRHVEPHLVRAETERKLVRRYRLPRFWATLISFGLVGLGFCGFILGAVLGFLFMLGMLTAPLGN